MCVVHDECISVCQLCGHVLYTRVFRQPLKDITPYDVALEGFPEKPVAEFKSDYFEGVAPTCRLLVLQFRFFPL